MNIKEITTSSYITASKLPDADYVINPYVGCPHKCIYCYAEFMKRFSGHGGEEWGDFVDVKKCDKAIDFSKVPPSATILIGSVTDAYNPLEKKYEVTRQIVEKLTQCDARVEILTKSDLIVRDIEFFKGMRNCYIGISMNTMDDNLRKQIEPYASSVERRINALVKLHNEGVHTYLFMSPIFPVLSDCIEIIKNVSPYVDYICFENLNLRGAYLPRVMSFIQEYYPDLIDCYKTIYWNKDMSYWETLRNEIKDYCEKEGIDYRFYFYHDQIKKK